MDIKIKNYVGYALIIALVLLAISGIWYTASYSKSVEPIGYRNFAVSSEGRAIGVPDVALFTFSIMTEGGKDLGTLQKTNTEKANKAIAYVKEQGVDAKDIKTAGYSVEPRYQYYNCPAGGGICPPTQIVGYTINQTVSVKLRDFAKVGDILAGVVKNGANSVSQLQFTVDDPLKLQAEAKGEAIKRAREQAELIAKTGGFKLGQLISVEEGGGPVPVYDSYGMGGDMAASLKSREVMAVPAPVVEPGSQEVKVQVTLRYEIR